MRAWQSWNITHLGGIAILARASQRRAESTLAKIIFSDRHSLELIDYLAVSQDNSNAKHGRNINRISMKR